MAAVGSMVTPVAPVAGFTDGKQVLFANFDDKNVAHRSQPFYIAGITFYIAWSLAHSAITIMASNT